MYETTTEPTENSTPDALQPAVDGIRELEKQLDDIISEVDESGLGMFITQENRDRMEKLKAGVLEPEQITDDAADALIKGFAGVLSAAECRQAETESPRPDINESDEVKARIIGMLTENTGCDILDSGGVGGRMWERNRHIQNFDDIPACMVEVCADGREDGEVIISYNVYPYLCLFLDITEDSERLNTVLEVIMDTGGNGSYLEDVEDFLKAVKADKDGYACGGGNTYNYDNILSQVLQYEVFEVDGETYIALQIHGGCDVRGGYTKPQIFSLNEPDYFHIAQQDITAWCGCGSWSSDDAGCNWYFEGCAPSKPADWFYNRDNNSVQCMDCRQPVNFGVTESV
jgi:hypothetical protein